MGTRILLYLLITLCILTCTVRDICRPATCAVVMAFVCLGAAFEFFKVFKPWLFRILGVLLFLSLVGIEFYDPAGYQTFIFHQCLNLVWSVMGYRALSHAKTAERVQVGVLSIIPLVCLAVDMPALEFLLFLAVYFSVLFGFLIRQAMSEPSTGSLGLISGRIQGVKVSYRQFWRTIGILALSAFAVGGILFLIIPRWGADTPVPGLEQPKGGFPDVALDKTGKITLDPSLIFRVNVPENPEGYYWRIDIQNAFDGTSWRSLSTPVRRNRRGSQPDRLPYTLEFVREWRDYRIPSLPGTMQILRHPDATEAHHQFYEDSLGLWRRWGWKRGEPLMGYQFELADPHRDTARRLDYLTRHFGVLYAQIQGLDYLKEASALAFEPKDIWPGKRRNPISWLSIAKLAGDITGDAVTNREKADRISAYLKKNYQYSLERPPRKGPIVEDFLFRQPVGHCEVFSTTMAVLLAIEGVPVHNVTGFVSTEFHDGYNYVRSAHAHSWVEVYVDGHWENYDPTPSGAQQVEVSWLLRIDDWFSSYHPRDLYRWIATHLAEFGFGAGILIILSLLAILSIRWMRPRMQPTAVVWQCAWHALQNPDRPHARPIPRRTLEDWWQNDDPENADLQAFARDYIRYLYAPGDRKGESGLRMLMTNATILRRARRLKRG